MEFCVFVVFCFMFLWYFTLCFCGNLFYVFAVFFVLPFFITLLRNPEKAAFIFEGRLVLSFSSGKRVFIPLQAGTGVACLGSGRPFRTLAVRGGTLKGWQYIRQAV